MNWELYVCDSKNSAIRKVTPDRSVTTLCKQFAHPKGITVLPDGTLYFTDRTLDKVFKITQDGHVTTLVCKPNTDVQGPLGITLASDGNLYVAEYKNLLIRKITLDGVTSVLCGGTANRGNRNGDGSEAMFNFPYGLASHPDGTLFVADTQNCVIRKVTLDGQVSLFCGNPSEKKVRDGKGEGAHFYHPRVLTMGHDGFLYVADNESKCIRRIAMDGTVTTVFDTSKQRSFDRIKGLAVAPNGTIFFSDTVDHSINVISPQGQCEVLCGATKGFKDGTHQLASFNAPEGLVLRMLMEWSPSTHSQFSRKVKQHVLAVMMLALKNEDGTPHYPETYFYILPKDVLYIVIRCSVGHQ